MEVVDLFRGRHSGPSICLFGASKVSVLVKTTTNVRPSKLQLVRRGNPVTPEGRCSNRNFLKVVFICVIQLVLIEFQQMTPHRPLFSETLQLPFP